MYWHKRSRVCARRGSYLVVAFGGGYFGGFHEGKFYGAGAGGAVGGGELVGKRTQAGGPGGLRLRGHLVGAGGRGRSLALGNTWIFEKPTWRTSSQVSWKSSSVSPGKPTMMSVVSAMEGTLARR